MFLSNLMCMNHIWPILIMGFQNDNLLSVQANSKFIDTHLVNQIHIATLD